MVNAVLVRQLEVVMFNCSGSIAHRCTFAAAELVNSALMRQLESVAAVVLPNAAFCSRWIGQCCFNAAARISDVQLKRQCYPMLQICSSYIGHAAVMRQLELMMFKCSGSVAHRCKSGAAGLVSAALMRQLESVMFNCSGSVTQCCTLQQLDWSMLL
jgi:hypothetical protein